MFDSTHARRSGLGVFGAAGLPCGWLAVWEGPRIIDDLVSFYAEHDHLCSGSAVIRGHIIDVAGSRRSDLVLSGDMEYWAYLGTYGKWGFIPKVLLHTDGGQVPSGTLFQKFHNRYTRCSTIESWEARLVNRISEAQRQGYARLRGRVATSYTLAHVFVGRDEEARRTAMKYRDQLEGRKLGQVCRLGLRLGWLSWKPLCLLFRLRTRLQYWLANPGRSGGVWGSVMIHDEHSDSSGLASAWCR